MSQRKCLKISKKKLKDMNKLHFWGALVGLVLFLVIYTLLIGNFGKNKALYQVITFLSICAGFCITALSIIANSNFSKRLYNIESKEDNSKTKLHEFVDLFRTSIYLFLFTILLIISFINFAEANFLNYNIPGTNTSLRTIYRGTSWYFTMFSTAQIIILVRYFSKFVIQSSTHK